MSDRNLEDTDISPEHELAADVVEDSGDMGDDVVETNDVSSEGDGSSGLPFDIAASWPSRPHLLDGADSEANRWNTELVNMLKHKANVAAGLEKSGEQIIKEMGESSGVDIGDDADESTGSE